VIERREASAALPGYIITASPPSTWIRCRCMDWRGPLRDAA
jgi:hypothetical protein